MVAVFAFFYTFFSFPSWCGAQKVGALESGVSVRAVDKADDFLLLETDTEDGGDGRLGWVDGSCVMPEAFPALFQFSAELPDAVRMFFPGKGGGGGPVLLLLTW